MAATNADRQRAWRERHNNRTMHEYQDQAVLQAIEHYPYPGGLTALQIVHEMADIEILETQAWPGDSLDGPADGRAIAPALRRLLAAGKINKRVVNRTVCLWGMPENMR